LPLPEPTQLLELEMAVLVGGLTHCYDDFVVCAGTASGIFLPSSSSSPYIVSQCRCLEGNDIILCYSAQETLDFNLVVYSPYRDLAKYIADANATELAECAWYGYISTSPLLKCTGSSWRQHRAWQSF
jgi:hypothetical protein